MGVPCTALWAVLFSVAWAPTGAPGPTDRLYISTEAAGSGSADSDEPADEPTLSDAEFIDDRSEGELSIESGGQ